MTQGLILGSAALAAVLLGLLLHGEKRRTVRSYVLKGLALLLFAMVLVDCYLADDFIWVINGEIYGGVYYETTDVLQTFLRWGRNTTWAVCLMAVFFDSRLFKGLALYLSLPFNIVSVFQYDRFMSYFLRKGTEIRRGFDLPAAGRGMLPAALAAFLLAMPSYAPQSLWGYTRIRYASFNLPDLLFLFGTFLLTSLLWRGFRNTSRRTQHMVVYYLALVLFMHHNTQYLMGLSFDKLPFQLCNLGCYTILLALLLKKRGFFDFTFIANVMGTLIAIVIPELSDGILSFWSIHYVIEHTLVFAVPVLAVLFGMYPRPDKRSLLHVTVGFLIYYTFCLTVGTIINGYAVQYGYSKVNYFFMFDPDMVRRVLPFASFSVKWHLVIGRFEFWPVMQGLVLIVYLLLCYLFYFVCKKVFAWMDDREEIRQARIRMTDEWKRKKQAKDSQNTVTTEEASC